MSGFVTSWLAEPLPREVSRAVERLARAPDVEHVAVMPDVHLSRDVCIGVATATRSTLYPQAVGGDIGCGIMALAYRADAALLGEQATATRFFDGLYRRVPQNRYRVRDGPRAWRDGVTPDALSHGRLRRLAEREGLPQLGTLGRGNHFLELQGDEEGQLWVMVHSGSRAMGPAIRDWHLRHATQRGCLLGLDVHADEGRAYLADLRWALAYAETNRTLMVEAVSDIVGDVLGAEPIRESAIRCHHNFVELEHHGDTSLWVHRKGAIAAAEGKRGIIAGSMGTPSYHVIGRGCEAALCSSSHGAGRVMSRSDARRRISLRDLGRQMSGVWFDHRRASRLRDEAPAAYKDIDQVMRAQRELIRIERRLHPLLSYKGV
ncbi:MAG: RtcB family protein [Myxococcota bacterium]